MPSTFDGSRICRNDVTGFIIPFLALLFDCGNTPNDFISNPGSVKGLIIALLTVNLDPNNRILMMTLF